MNGYEKQVKEQLRQNGWQFHRKGKGSHEIWTNGSRCIAVSYECRSRHTANAIMKEAGIDHKF